MNEDLMLQNTDRINNGVGPYLTPKQRKRYIKKGIVHYHLNRIRETQGVPNPYLHAWEFQKQDSIRAAKRKAKKDTKKDKQEKEEKNPSQPESDSSSEDEDSDEEDLREDKHKPKKKDKKKKQSMPDNPLQVQAQEKEPQDELPEMPMQDFVGKHPFRMVLSGKTGSGKSTLLTWLVNTFYADYFTDIIVMAKTLKEDPVWRYARIDRDLMFETFDVQKLEAIEKAQHDYIETHGIATARRILLIIDDFAADQGSMRATKLSDMFFYGRKKSISLVILTQQYNSVFKKNRENAEWIIAFPTGNNAEQEALQNEQRSIYFHSGREGNYCFDEIFRFCTVPDEIDDYPFLVINHQSEDKTQIYRKRLHGLITLKINPLTHMVDADFTLKGRRERAQQGKLQQDQGSFYAHDDVSSKPMSLQETSQS